LSKIDPECFFEICIIINEGKIKAIDEANAAPPIPIKGIRRISKMHLTTKQIRKTKTKF
jgi:hypothetical protein